VRRRQSTKEPPTSAIRRCEGCGATASLSALQCTICGRPFASADQVSQLWGPVETLPLTDDLPLLDLYASEGDGRIFRVGGAQADSEAVRLDLASDLRPPVGPKTDPWASGSGTLATLPGKPDSGGFVAPATATKETASRPGGSGPRRVLIVLLVVLIVGGTAAWLAGRPYLSLRIAADVGGAIDDELDGVAALPIDESGQITIVERDITRSLRGSAGDYAPVTDPRVALSRNGVRVTFTLYGVEQTLTGTLAVEEGRIVLVDPTLTGPASQLIDPTEVVAATEEAIADMFARLDARPVSVKTSDDTLVIVTEPV